MIELHYLPMMLEANAFDAIVHEHLEYYSLAVIERLIARRGPRGRLAPSSTTSTAARSGCSSDTPASYQRTPEQHEALKALRVKEFELALDSPEPYEAFRLRLGARARRPDGAAASEFTTKVSESTSTAPRPRATRSCNTRASTASLIEAAADRNPDKWGSETIGTRIPIISEEDSRAMNPDYYLALPWHFLDEFLEREQEFLERGGQFIVPLPDVRVVGGS